MTRRRPRRNQGDPLTMRWDAVPGVRQDYYRRVYQRELRKAGATTDDAAELVVLRRLINAYRDQALVPVGTRWASVPERVRDAARRGQPVYDPQDDPIQPLSGSPRWLLVLLLPLLGLFLLALSALAGGTEDTSGALVVSATPSETAIPTLEVSPTPTPLALEESDRFIRAGASRNRDYFPVLLRVRPAPDVPVRVFVVQERAIDTADWRFDPNPDVASWVSGLLVSPVFGLPYSDDNAELVGALGPGARFEIQMNTGATLTFDYASTRQVARAETDVFRQVEPGIVLILIGQTGADGLLTEHRPVVIGRYPVEQEVERLRMGELAPVVLAGEPGMVSGLDGVKVTLSSPSSPVITSDSLPDDLAYARVDLVVATGGDGLRSSDLIWLLEDQAGDRYSPAPVQELAESEPGFPPLPDVMAPHTELQTSLDFLVPRGLTTARLLVSATGGEAIAFALTFEPVPRPVTAAALDVRLHRASYDAEMIYIDVRLFNPLAESISLAGEQPHLILAHDPAAPGPAVWPEMLNLPDSVAPGTAIDLELVFPYSGEPYARLSLLAREYALHMPERR